MARRSIVKFEEGLRAQVEAERLVLAGMKLDAEQMARANAEKIAIKEASVNALAGVLEDLAADVVEDEAEG
jgi:hypothetical protein